MQRRVFWLMIVGDLAMLFAAWSLVTFVATGPFDWSLFWWSMALTAVALLLQGAPRLSYALVARRRGGAMADQVRRSRLTWLAQLPTLVTYGLVVGLIAGGTRLEAVVVAYGVALLVFLVVVPVVLTPFLVARARRTRPRGPAPS